VVEVEEEEQVVVVTRSLLGSTEVLVNECMTTDRITHRNVVVVVAAEVVVEVVEEDEEVQRRRRWGAMTVDGDAASEDWVMSGKYETGYCCSYCCFCDRNS
jgi:nucleoside diphosphate kinase